MTALGVMRYSGPRTGVFAAGWAVGRMSVRRAWGSTGAPRDRVAPALAIGLAYVPTIVFIGTRVMGRRAEIGGVDQLAGLGVAVTPSFGQHYLQISLAVLVVGAFIGPHVLCDDRADGLVEPVQASPLGPLGYLLAKLASLLVVSSVVTVGPVALLVLGYASQGAGPVGVAGWATAIGRILLGGLAVSLLHMTVALAVSAWSTSRAVASAAYLGLFVTSSAAVVLLVSFGDLSNRLGLLNLGLLPYELAARIWGEPSAVILSPRAEVPAALVVGGSLLWMLSAMAVALVGVRRRIWSS